MCGGRASGSEAGACFHADIATVQRHATSPARAAFHGDADDPERNLTRGASPPTSLRTGDLGGPVPQPQVRSPVAVLFGPISYINSFASDLCVLF